MTVHAYFKGILLSLLIGLSAFSLSIVFPFMNAILSGLVLGICIGNLMRIPGTYQAGITFTSGKLLEFSLLFLAFGISYKSIATIGSMSFIFVIVTILAVMLISLYMSKRLKFGNSTCHLIGFGTAICGSSAIAAIASSVTKDKEDVGISLAVVNLLGAVGMISLPLLLDVLHISAIQSGFMIGGSLHSVGNVAGAGYSMGTEVGQTAITIKLVRVAMLSPALIFFRYMVNKKDIKNWRDHLRLPWYVWSFIGISILAGLIHIPDHLVQLSETAGKIILTIAMAAIGLKVSVRTLYMSGKKAIATGLLIFCIQLMILGLFCLFL